MFRYKDSHVVTARAAVTVIHPELGCLISCIELQKYSIILLYAEEGCSPGQQNHHHQLSQHTCRTTYFMLHVVDCIGLISFKLCASFSGQCEGQG